jgi:hypothetical protein
MERADYILNIVTTSQRGNLEHSGTHDLYSRRPFGRRFYSASARIGSRTEKVKFPA